MRISIKKGVRIRAMQPSCVLGIILAGGVYEAYGMPEMVVTSICEGHHKRGSAHYTGNAFDLRIWGVGAPEELVRNLKSVLEEEFDVVLEKDHIHIEYDPKSA